MNTRKRVAMQLRLARQTHAATWESRGLRASDREDLAILLYAAFRGTIDDEGETFSGTLTEIDRVFAGDYGELLPDCSFVIERGEFLASACLIGQPDPRGAPLVIFSMTRPDAQRQGMARFLLRRSVNALLDHGHKRLTLVVTKGNAPAEHLYASLGFRPIS